MEAGFRQDAVEEKRQLEAQYKEKYKKDKELAESYYAQAKEQMQFLDEVVTKLQDYQAASDTIQRQLDGYNNNEGFVTLWSATSRDASGRLKGEFAGNGYLTQRIFDPYSGRLKEIKTGVAENDVVNYIGTIQLSRFFHSQ
ncbi:MAG: hypothetical protein DIZ77_03910 [endosymbiont of Seepiophila jonesi]|uniref:Uncharacterized protein n=1 Tax=endosymbiont of Lamellibrachia luymesi TaxID=2200907 RepID=A0A370DZF7_9GAMM|nr:MAG: hypothetical protein DIZ79_06570 [endosymbiont of Lamellibrachia luymesi]RDH93950.1 MAG: hypothetical protein DIZ77_03910 [endosymbiont of Seepiophila jonesi]